MQRSQPIPQYPPQLHSNPQRMPLPRAPMTHNDSAHNGACISSAPTGSSVSRVQQRYRSLTLNDTALAQQHAAAAGELWKCEMRPPQPTSSPFEPYLASPRPRSPGLTFNTSFSSSTGSSHFRGSGASTVRYPPGHPLGMLSLPSAMSTSSTPDPCASTPLEHHHYIKTPSQSTYHPLQDRYICQACRKAFSRPSSLKIHSHSHTGEKPFICPHPQCRKAFSVRSNMKRHERGCHTGLPAEAIGGQFRLDT